MGRSIEIEVDEWEKSVKYHHKDDITGRMWVYDARSGEVREANLPEWMRLRDDNIFGNVRTLGEDKKYGTSCLEI